MRAAANPVRRIDRLDADKTRPGRIDERRAAGQHAPDMILILGERARHAEIIGRGLAIDLAAGGMTFFDAHHAHGLAAIGHDPVRRSDLHHAADQRIAEASRRGEFERALAREGQRAEAGRNAAADRDLRRAHRRKFRLRDRDRGINEGLDNRRRFRPGDGELHPAVGDRREVHVEFRPQDLPAILHVTIDRRGVSGRNIGDKSVLREAGEHAIVLEETILAQHDEIAASPDLDRGGAHREGEIKELGRVRTLDLHFAERRDIRHADAGADGVDLAVGRRQKIRVACKRKILRPLPLTDIDERRAALKGVSVDRRLANGPEGCALVSAGDGAERHGNSGRPGQRDAGLRDRLTGELRHDCERVEIRGAALVRRHAERRIALQMLDGAIAFAMRERDVGRRDVMLEIDKHLGAVIAAWTPPGRRRSRRGLPGGGNLDRLG